MDLVLKRIDKLKFSTFRCLMRSTIALTAFFTGFATIVAFGSEASIAIQGEIPTIQRIAEVCRSAAANGQWGSDPDLQAILVRQTCTIQWPSFLILSTGCSAKSDIKKCIDDAFSRSFSLPVGPAKITYSYCRDDNCFDVYEVRDPEENGTQRYDECGYILSGKAMVRDDKAYVAIADLNVTVACLKSPI